MDIFQFDNVYFSGLRVRNNFYLIFSSPHIWFIQVFKLFIKILFLLERLLKITHKTAWQSYTNPKPIAFYPRRRLPNVLVRSLFGLVCIFRNTSRCIARCFLFLRSISIKIYYIIPDNNKRTNTCGLRVIFLFQINIGEIGLEKIIINCRIETRAVRTFTNDAIDHNERSPRYMCRYTRVHRDQPIRRPSCSHC